MDLALLSEPPQKRSLKIDGEHKFPLMEIALLNTPPPNKKNEFCLYGPCPVGPSNNFKGPLNTDGEHMQVCLDGSCPFGQHKNSQRDGEYKFALMDLALLANKRRPLEH